MSLEDRTVDSHPSYGMAGFFRSQGGNFNLFGSSIRHNNTISLQVSRGERHRDLSHDWYHDRDRLIEVRFSQTQFAELLTTMNCGSGVPCTLEFVQGEGVMPPIEDVTNKKEEIRNEFNATAKEIGKRLDGIKEQCDAVLANPKPSKAQRDGLKENIRMLIQEVVSNLPFVAKAFDEMTDKVVAQAKGEIDAAFTGAIHRLGMKALHEAIGSDHLEVPALEYHEEATT